MNKFRVRSHHVIILYLYTWINISVEVGDIEKSAIVDVSGCVDMIFNFGQKLSLCVCELLLLFNMYVCCVCTRVHRTFEYD